MPASVRRGAGRRRAILACAGLTGAVLPVAGLAAGPASADISPVCVDGPTTATCTFAHSASAYSWTVPAGVTTVTVTADGGAGADGANGAGGPGGEYLASLSGLAGQTLSVTTGGAGTVTGGGNGGGGNGGTAAGLSDAGGGGGQTVVSAGLTTLIVAGGGGGGSTASDNGGAGGTSSSTAGGAGGSRDPNQSGGAGGSTVPQHPGAAGNEAFCSAVTAGSPGLGGAGGTSCVAADAGGGGGAGFEGGGGGGDYSGGGGGSSFPAAAFTAGGITVTPEADTNTNAGDGKVVITYGLLSSATTLTSSGPNPSSFGQSVSFTATVNPADGGGTVTFKDAGTPITGCAGESLTHQSGSTYTAGCTTSTLPGGTDAITASYSGDSTYAGSGSNTIDQVVNAVRTRLRAAGEVTASGDIFVSATLTAGGRPVAGQLITFTAGPGITVCTATTNGSGVATCEASQEGGAMIALSEGVFTATFAGTANDDAAQATGFVTGR